VKGRIVLDMVWSNFMITLVGVGSVVYLMKKDVRSGSNMLRQNLKTMRGWLEEQGTTAASTVKEEAKQVEGQLKKQAEKLKSPD
jgi:hypothetical protein